MGVPFILGGVLKITYDLLLYRLFRALRPPEERDEQGDKPEPAVQLTLMRGDAASRRPRPEGGT